MSSRASTRREFLRETGVYGLLASPWLGLAPVRGQAAVNVGQRQRIEAAIPEKAFVKPHRARKLLIFDRNVGYGGHGSIPTANLAFTLTGQKTGAFETVVSRDPAVFRPESLRQFDAVFFNNNVGNLFEDPHLRQSLIDFVYGGGGLMGVHGTTVAFTRWPGAHEDWPEFGIMLGARGANHYDSDEHVFIKLDAADHPVNQPFGGAGFEYRDEFFRVHGPYSRERVRVLFSIDTQKTKLDGQPRGNCHREDGDYALAWVRQYGRGRVFYCTIAHNPYVFWDAKMLRFYLAATQFALGDLAAPTTPSAKLTPAVRAQEQLGWRLGLTPPVSVSREVTLFDHVDRAAEFGALYVGASDLQQVRPQLAKNFDGRMSDDERKEVRLKLDAAGVRLLIYRLHRNPVETAGWREVFEFGRKMGIETFIGGPPVATVDTIEKLCDEYDIRFALDGNDSDVGRLLQICRGRSERVGVWGDPAAWTRRGLDPVETVRVLGRRLAVLQISNGSGPVLKEIRRLGLKPVMFGIECPPAGADAPPGIVESIESFNQMSVQLAK